MADPDNEKEIGANIPGMISKLNATVGDSVKKNEVLAIIEAMKMETTIVAKCAGVVGKIYVTENHTVKAGELMMVIE
jgi:pyruvate carboxylase